MTMVRENTVDWGKQYLPYGMLAVCALLCLLLSGGIVGLLMLAAGFVIGQFSINGVIPWATNRVDKQAMGEEILRELKPNQTQKLEALVARRRDVEAVNQLRAMTGASVTEATGAVEVLRQMAGAR